LAFDVADVPLEGGCHSAPLEGGNYNWPNRLYGGGNPEL
jgi:hypothetical protein